MTHHHVARVLTEALLDHRMNPCGDCLATAELTEVKPGIVMLEVKHDLTCPTYRAKNQNK
ncbi:hypothetical protein SCMC78_04560 [Streptomyces sp. CMC78]|uniref:Transposase n=1 Tax=Streptomyces sp. CMC78 TaxID=3231512 RepID=A0AB33KB29_9ACTN